MSCIGKGKLITFELKDARLVTLDLDCEDDYGDVTVSNSDGISRVLIGNDEDGYVEPVRFFEELDNDEVNRDFIERKWKTFAEVDKLDVIEWILVRMLAFCDGYTMENLKKDLEDYGLDIKRVNIPKEWKR